MKDSNPKSGLRLDIRLVGIVLLAIAPAMVVLHFNNSLSVSLIAAVVVLAVTLIATRLLFTRKLRELRSVIQRLASGDLSARTELAEQPDEIGELARSVDRMAATLNVRGQEREREQHGSLNRALQQAAVAALGQFALTSSDFGALLNQAATLVTQTLEIEFCRILELLPDGKSLLLRAGVGWRKGLIGIAVVDADPRQQAGYTLQSGEPVVIPDLRRETRFSNDPLLGEHRALSGMSVALMAGGQTYGVLATYSAKQREFDSDDVQFLLSVANILAVAVERTQADAELKKLADFARLNPNPAMEMRPDGSISYFNEAAQHLAQALGRENPKDILPGDIDKEIRICLTTGRSRLHMESRLQNHVLSWSLHPMAVNQVVHCYVTDITDRLNLEAQLRQSQKMESVGQLAAGVAHDFNNMLTVIQGHAGMLMARPTLPTELRDSVQSVSFAAERAASLTRQLLMFSRKSVMQPKLVDLREVVGNMTKMLKRLLGENITLEFEPPIGLPLIEADPAMMEQVIMNLSVNARDAMAMGGKLSVRMDPVTLEEDYIGTHPEAYAGTFVRLRFVDTGHGMKPATIARIFEPFFTTKEAGKGTGLGLATVYGIIKQHKGWIEVASEFGKGTAFSIFLPAASETTVIRRKQDIVVPQVVGGTETILLVEDEATVLEMGKIILQDCGYRVLEASSGVAAVEIWQQHRDSIAMLLTDMVMPQGVSGTDLARMFLEDKPSLKVLFTSGYSVDQFDTDFIRAETVNFLQKPYTRFTLAKAVRERLDQ